MGNASSLDRTVLTDLIKIFEIQCSIELLDCKCVTAGEKNLVLIWKAAVLALNALSQASFCAKPWTNVDTTRKKFCAWFIAWKTVAWQTADHGAGLPVVTSSASARFGAWVANSRTWKLTATMLTGLRAALIARGTFAGVADSVTGVGAAKVRSTRILAFWVRLLLLTNVASLNAGMATWKNGSAALVADVGLIHLRADNILGMAAREYSSGFRGAAYEHLAWNSLRARRRMEMTTWEPHCRHFEIAPSATFATFSGALVTTLVDFGTLCGTDDTTILMHLERVTAADVSSGKLHTGCNMLTFLYTYDHKAEPPNREPSKLASG